MEKLLNEYDELHRQLAETYGAHIGHGRVSFSITNLHQNRHKLAQKMRKVREDIINYATSAHKL